MTTTLAPAPAPKVTQVFRLRYRLEDGTAVYELVGADIYLLTVSPDGSTLHYHLVGVCSECFDRSPGRCARPDCSRRDDQNRPEPEQEGDAEVRELYRVTPPRLEPVDEPVGVSPEPELAPDHVDPAPDQSEASGFAKPPEPVQVSYEVEQAARAIAAAVRRGARSRAELSRGLQRSAIDRYMDYAVDQQWVVLAGDRVTLGPVDSRPATTTSIPNW
jgi:hypothetical protein